MDEFEDRAAQLAARLDGLANTLQRAIDDPDTDDHLKARLRHSLAIMHCPPGGIIIEPEVREAFARNARAVRK